jgi:hypothetical protein
MSLEMGKKEKMYPNPSWKGYRTQWEGKEDFFLTHF